MKTSTKAYSVNYGNMKKEDDENKLKEGSNV